MTNSNQYMLETATTAASAVRDADRLFDMREEFEARTNWELYNLLAGIYSLYRNAAEQKYTDDAVKLMGEKLKKFNVRIQSNTPSLTVFVRYVYRTDRKKAYTYSQVLNFADKKGVTPADLPSFIDANGGVEKCKEANKSGLGQALSVEDRKEQIKTYEAFATIQLDASQYDPAKATDVVFVVGKIDADGRLELLKVLQDVNASMLKQAAPGKQKAESDDPKSEVVVTKQIGEGQSIKDLIGSAIDQAVAA